MRRWTSADIPDQSGCVAVVTGASSGIGLETSRVLAAKGALVVLACRDPRKAESALARLRAADPAARVARETLDLADLESIAAFAARVAAAYPRLDLLVNNAGVMVPPLARTVQGFELQFGTNHLGHFALTQRLLPLLEASSGSRVVVVSSFAQNFAHIDLDDLNWERRRYARWHAYGQSKLASTMFAFELGRRLAARGSHVCVTVAHPGWTETDLSRHCSPMRVLAPLLAMTVAAGALPILRAATDPQAHRGSFYGPAYLFEAKGPPVHARVPKHAADPAVAARLFDASERLVGLSFAPEPR